MVGHLLTTRENLILTEMQEQITSASSEKPRIQYSLGLKTDLDRSRKKAGRNSKGSLAGTRKNASPFTTVNIIVQYHSVYL